MWIGGDSVKLALRRRWVEDWTWPVKISYAAAAFPPWPG